MAVYQIHGLREKLRLGKFVITVELEPPKGANPLPILEKAKFLKGQVDAVNIADSPMATMRMSPIALAHIIQQDMGIEAIFHLTSRDRNIIGLQSELLGASALGVKNILVLRGDEPIRGDHKGAKAVFEVDAIGLARIAATLNKGVDLEGNKLIGETSFFIGAAANPLNDLEKEFLRLKEKIEAGVDFVQTQPVFSIEAAERFLDKVGSLPLAIIFGILPLKSLQIAKYLRENVPGIVIPEDVFQRIEKGGRRAGVEIAQELIEELRNKVAGIHLYPIGDIDLVQEVLTSDNIRKQVL